MPKGVFAGEASGHGFSVGGALLKLPLEGKWSALAERKGDRTKAHLV
ncbi:MAG: hypothetical protein J6Z11_01695 [Candidatus Riflebacteria bacterium]|nr:hypothetical protein [Candidatus Riflebacteria bacterium]